MQHTASSGECQGLKYSEQAVNWSLNPSIEIQNKLFIDIMVQQNRRKLEIQ